MTASSTRTLTRDGVALVCFETPGDGPPVLLIHGWCCDHSYLAPQARHFSGLGRRVVAVDLRGHGRSDKPRQPYPMAAFADDGAATRLQTPALYIAADEPTPRTDLVRLRELAPGMLYGQTVGSGHFCQLEVPDQVNAMIDRFLRLAAPQG